MAAVRYNYGTEARELEYGASLEAQRRREEAENAKRRKKLAAEKKQRGVRTKAVKSLVVITAILALIMIREAQIDMLCGKISAKEKEAENLYAVVTEREMHLSGALDLKMVEETATSKLGMKKPDQSQYIYIDMAEPDSGQVLKDSDNGGSITDKIKGLLEYLY